MKTNEQEVSNEESADVLAELRAELRSENAATARSKERAGQSVQRWARSVAEEEHRGCGES
jgi:hypothetical protein